MSDYADTNTFSGWAERDDWRDLDQAEHDRTDAKHEAWLDRRDRDLLILLKPTDVRAYAPSVGSKRAAA